MWKKSVDLATNIKLGTRVRHVEDGVEGRIVWANASAVKIQWDDGEKVTWKRAELGAKGLAVIEQDESAEQQAGEATAAATPPETPEPTPDRLPRRPVIRGDGREVMVTVPPRDEEPADAGEPREVPAPPDVAKPTQTAGETSALEAASESATPAEPVAAAEPGAAETPAEAKPAKKPRTRKPKTESAEGQKKPSALDAAAKVLGEEMRPMSTKELIGLMAAKGYWTSPGGKTPAATLYSAILREMDTKGEQARFEKVGKGQFKLRQA